MLTTVIALLFTLTAIAAVLVIADSVMKARRAYARLMSEAAVMHAGFAVQGSVQVGTHELRARLGAARTMPDRRLAALALPSLPLVPVCVAA